MNSRNSKISFSQIKNENPFVVKSMAHIKEKYSYRPRERCVVYPLVTLEEEEDCSLAGMNAHMQDIIGELEQKKLHLEELTLKISSMTKEINQLIDKLSCASRVSVTHN